MGDGDGTMQSLVVTECAKCPALVSSRSRIVNGVGPADAELLIAGEAPGADEDAGGEPFVGRSGGLLTEKLAAAGIDRANVRITNCVRCRPPENRDPRSAELSNCSGWLERELEQVDPAVVLAVGKVPASQLLGREVAVTAEAGRVERAFLGGRERPVVICVHPAAVFYDRSQEPRLEGAIGEAARSLGISPPGDDQARLGEF